MEKQGNNPFPLSLTAHGRPCHLPQQEMEKRRKEAEAEREKQDAEQRAQEQKERYVRFLSHR